MKNLKKVLSVLICASMLIIQAFTIIPVKASAENKSWAGTWSTAPVNAGYSVGGRILCDFLSNCSARTVIKTTVGGEKIRLRFSNRYAASDLAIEKVRVARTSDMSDTAIIDGTTLPVTFNGSQSVTIPKGKTMYSDPIDMHIESFEKITVSVYYKSFTYMTTSGLTNAITYIETGDKTEAKSFSANAPLSLTSGTITYHTTPFLCGVDAYGSGNSCIVMFGDSTLANDSPYYLAEKLYLGGDKNTGVLQESIIGNHLLHDISDATRISCLYGEAGLTRFKEDVLDQSGVKAVYVKIGINDFLHAETKSMASSVPKVTVDDMINGYRQLAAAAKNAGIKIYFFGRQAWKGYERDFFGSDGKDLVWTQKIDDNFATINKYLKYSCPGDGYINVDILRDPQDKNKVYAPYTTDGAHLTPLGARVLVDAIPNIFLSNKTLSPIVDYYNSGKGDIQNFTPKNKYTVYTPPATTAVNSGSANNPPANSAKPNTTVPKTTSVILTNAGGTPTEIFLVEMPQTNPPAASDSIQTEPIVYSNPDGLAQAPENSMSTTAKAGIIIFVILTVGIISFGVIYGVNKKKSVD